MAEESAVLFKNLNRSVPIALVTNAQSSDYDFVHPTPFDFILPIDAVANPLPLGEGTQARSDGHSRQWLTRLQYLAATPFALTLALDTNVHPCEDVSALLDAAEREAFDFAAASGSTGEPGLSTHNFALMYRWSARTEALVSRWLALQLQAAVHDDQHTLTRAIAELRAAPQGPTVRKLGNAAAVSLIPIDRVGRGDFPRESRLLDGPAALVHWAPGPNGAYICGLLNRDRGARRVLYQHGAKGERIEMLVGAAAHAAVAGNATLGWDWAAPPLQPFLSDPWDGAHGWM